MTIRKRLFWSNILMLVVPAIIAAIVGIFCICMVWLVIRQGSGMGIEDSGDLYWAGRITSKVVTSALDEAEEEQRQHFDRLTTMLDAGSMRLVVAEDGRELYAYGESQAADGRLVSSARAMNLPSVQISVEGRSLYFARLSVNGREVVISLLGTPGEHLGSGLRLAVALSALLVLAAILLSILLTNRFLTRFVFRKIADPLELLAAGARRIGEGDLDCRIVYEQPDEFAPVCAAFNEMAKRLKGSVERARRDEESRKELLAGISHDLCSPLTSIQAYVEGLLDGVARTDEAKDRYLRTIHAKATDIDRLVSQLFVYSKLDLEGFPIQCKALHLDRFLDQLIGELSADYQARGLELVPEPFPPVKVCADPSQLRRVILNIWDNSAKYKNKPVGQASIRLDAKGVLILSDDGPGVPEDALPKLFDVFYRSDPARKNPAGAADWAWPSRPGGYSEWGEPSGPMAPLPGGWPSKLHCQRRRNQMRSILIVEDDGDIAAIERDYLELNGYRVEIAPDGITGLERGRSGTFDLILLDLMLPGMDGFSLCRRLRETIDIPILMVTARQEDIDKIRGLGLGADDYIEKPFSPSVLVARVNAYLARYERLTGGQRTARSQLQVGEIRINTDTRRVFVGEREVQLKNKEYELLLFLILHLDMVFSREDLYEKVWGLDALGDNATVAVHINRLREKLEQDPGHPQYIQTVWGAGYRFRAQ